MEIIEKLKKIKDRFENINQQLSDPDILSDRGKVISLSKERSDLIEIVKAYENYSEVLKNIEGNREIISSGADTELT